MDEYTEDREERLEAMRDARRAREETDRRDAARYRAWRKIVSTFPTCRPCNTPEQTVVRQMAEHECLKETVIDAYIDAAIAHDAPPNTCSAATLSLIPQPNTWPADKNPE